MPRAKNTKNEKKVLSVKIYHEEPQEVILYEGEFATLKEVANELGLSYSQAFELSSRGRSKSKKPKFKYYPIIDIKRTEPTQADIKVEKEKDLCKQLCEKYNVPLPKSLKV